MTVYPISKLTPQRVSAIIREHGSERMIVNGSADWGISDPLSLVKVVEYMKNDGHTEDAIDHLVLGNAMSFYGGSGHWKPELNLVPVDPTTFQR
jgi:predicted metal-dependent TIM-barrel fold hydrolase